MSVESGGTSLTLLLGAMIGLVGLAIAVFVVTLIYFGRQDGKKETKPRRAGRAAPAAAPLSAPLSAPQSPVVAPGQTQSDKPEAAAVSEAPAIGQKDEVMRVLYDPRSSRVLVEVAGRRYERLSEIEDAHVGRRVLWAIADLIRFTGGMATNPRVVRSASEGAAWDGGLSRAVPGQSVTRPVPGPTLSETVATAASPAKLGQAMSAFFQRGLSPAPSPGAVRPGTFIEQIEAILQAKLLEVDFPPAYEIHVSAGPEQRLRIQVGREFYGSIDEVPNLQAQALIRAAVEEWERGH